MRKYSFAKISFFIFLFLILAIIYAAIFLNPMIKSTVNSANAIIADFEVIDESVSTVDFLDSEPAIPNKNTIVSPEATQVIALLLDPYIRAAIDNYFGEPTQYASYNSTIKEIAQVGNDFVYKVTISVETFRGAHNPPYGIETMTFIIKTGGRVVLDDYVHQNI